MGGFVEKEWNLSQNGSSWIFDNAVCMEQARVQGDAVLLQSAMAREGTLIGGTARISGKSIVKGRFKDLMMLENGLKKIRSKNELGKQTLFSQKTPALKINSQSAKKKG